MPLRCKEERTGRFSEDDNQSSIRYRTSYLRHHIFSISFLF